MNDAVYKIEAEGDSMYYAASTEDEAYKRICEFIGDMPRSLLTFKKMKRDKAGTNGVSQRTKTC